MAYNKLNFSTYNLADPTSGARQGLTSAGALLAQEEQQQNTKKARQDALLARAEDNTFRNQKLAQDKALADARLAQQNKILAGAEKDRLAKAIANDALIQAMTPENLVGKKVITKEDAVGSLMADPKILAQKGQGSLPAFGVLQAPSAEEAALYANASS